MIDCRQVEAALPEYVAGRYVAGRDRIAGHLTRCTACDSARREMEVVFALLAETPDPPATAHGESIARLALRTAVAPGPVRANQNERRRSDRRLMVCSGISVSGAAAAAYLVRQTFRSLHAARHAHSIHGRIHTGSIALASHHAHAILTWLGPWAGHALTYVAAGSLLWKGVLVVAAIGSFSAMLPALLRHSGPGSRGAVRGREA